MSIIDAYLTNLAQIKDKLPKVAEEAIMSNYSEIVMLVKSEQLGKGLNSEGRPMRWNRGNGYYKPATQLWYNADYAGSVSGNQVPKTEGEPYNFMWSGETLDNTQLKVYVEKQSFEIFTVRRKQHLLEQMMGYGELFTLTKEHNKYVNNEIIMPYLYNYVLRELFNV